MRRTHCILDLEYTEEESLLITHMLFYINRFSNFDRKVETEESVEERSFAGLREFKKSSLFLSSH